jgi:MYXO-CTERM domain-containing protein
MRDVVLVVVSMAAAASTPSRACDPFVAVLDTAFPFEGHTVPRNATLGAVDVDDTIFGELVGDDGVVRRVAWSDDDARFTPELPDGVLPVGRQVLTLLSTEDDNVSRDIVFGVDNDLDTDAAAVSVSITRRIGGDTALGQENPCASTPWPTTFATIAVEDGGDDAAFIQLPSGERLRLFDGTLEVSETNRDLSNLVVVDFAGNASTPEVVDAGSGSGGGGGCGCQSNATSTAGLAGFAGFAVALRRRRRH